MMSSATASSVRVVLAAVSTCLIVLAAASAAFAQPIRRVPAEFEPQEAIWLQWPGRFEKTYEPAYAEISNVIVQYQKTLWNDRLRSQPWYPTGVNNLAGCRLGRQSRMRRSRSWVRVPRT
jgi:surfactin synthase thioesterase subunit